MNPGTLLADAAYAIVDVETTGLRPGYDRVVEICVVRMDPGDVPRIAIDTLVDPRRPVAATQIHGIEERDIDGAPTFSDIAGEVLRAVAGRVMVGHNFAFDRHFLAHELLDVHAHVGGPFVETSYLRPLVGAGDRASLADMCTDFGLQRSGHHAAAADAFDTLRVLQVLLERAAARGIRTFADLAAAGDHAFLASLGLDPVTVEQATALPACAVRKPRTRPAANQPLRVYYNALLLVIADGVITADELASLATTRRHLDLGDEDVFALHGQAFAGALLAGIADSKVRPPERAYLANLATCLRLLGWCPGDPLPV